jgi:NTP pyrophosphatase (non-canonical NTP hydrolase)
MIELPERAAMPDYQRYIHDLESLHGWLQQDLVHNCFRMGEEVGELFKAVRQYEKAPAEARTREHVGEELVDVLNYLLAIANRAGVDLEQAFRQKNARNQQRTW